MMRQGTAALSALLLGLLAATAVSAQQASQTVSALAPKMEIEPAATAILKAMSDKLAAARTLSFKATTTYESIDRTGQPLAYMALSEVTLQRPDKLRVIVPGDGPRTEFFYNGKTVQAWEPAAKLLATATAPDSIDLMLKAAFDNAEIYFPFTDVIVSDPFKAISEHLQMAFLVGKSIVVGDVPTDVIVLVGKVAHVQLWIGSEDKLPRLARATFFGDPAQYRHGVRFTDWKLDQPLPANAFVFTPPNDATSIRFKSPDTLPAAPTAK